jgi:uncharacterized protein (UPF0212 family)
MDASDPICPRCSKPVTEGTAARYAAGPMHVRCLAHETQLLAIEQQDTARRLVECARAAVARAAERATELVIARLGQTDCPVCGRSLSHAGSVLLQGKRLVHELCWRADPKRVDAPPAA